MHLANRANIEWTVRRHKGGPHRKPNEQRPGKYWVELKITEHYRYLLTPEEAMAMADELVDAAETLPTAATPLDEEQAAS